MTTPKLLKPKEAALLLGIDVKTLYRWLKNGWIKGIPYGRNWRIPSTELEAPNGGAKERRDETQ